MYSEPLESFGCQWNNKVRSWEPPSVAWPRSMAVNWVAIQGLKLRTTVWVDGKQWGRLIVSCE